MENGAEVSATETSESAVPTTKPHVGAAAKNRCVYLDKSADDAANTLLKALKSRQLGWSYSRLVNTALREFCEKHTIDDLAPVPVASVPTTPAT